MVLHFWMSDGKNFENLIFALSGSNQLNEVKKPVIETQFPEIWCYDWRLQFFQRLCVTADLNPGYQVTSPHNSVSFFRIIRQLSFCDF